MKIGIAINGEGRGHLSRARALAELLRERYDLAFWAPEHLTSELRDLFPDAEIREIPYLKFVQRGFTLDYGATVAANAALMLNPYRACARIAKQMREASVSMLLSDFEPFSSRAAKAIGIPVLQLNHPSVVTRSFPRDPSALFHQLAAIAVSLYMTAHSDRTIVCSFFDGDVGPIIRKSLRELRVERGNYFVVYMKPLYRDWLESALDGIGRNLFRVFPDPHSDYDKALAGARALIAPAGHQSVSEALALGKPVFAIPVSGQGEQTLNAAKLRESGFGDWAKFEDIAEALPRFIANAETYEDAIAKSRLTAKRTDRAGFCCEDQTFRAACMVENFILESRVRPEWKRKSPALSLLPVFF